MSIKVAHVNKSDISGGAARAAQRIHRALRANGVASDMYVARALSDDSSVHGPESQLSRGWNLVRTQLRKAPYAVFRAGNSDLHSFAILPSMWARRVNGLEVDLVHLHWLGSEMMSIGDIGRIKKPVVWTLHDMWPFCGAEHYSEEFRWRDGYTSLNRPNYESGPDLNRWTWKRKRRAWKRPMRIVAPSDWLAGCARRSILMHNWPVSVIPNPLDTNLWRPIDKCTARDLLGIPSDRPIVAFGSMRGNSYFYKGFDLLFRTLEHLRGEIPGLELINFGESLHQEFAGHGFPVRYVGHLSDVLSLRVLYSAADLIVVPSRKEAFGQVASEAFSCGTPAVAFNNTGLADIITHRKTGWLASEFDPEDLARGIAWILEDESRPAVLGKNARNYAETHFSFPVVAKEYQALYEKALLQP